MSRRNCRPTRKKPRLTRNCTAMATEPVAKPRRRNSRGSRSGCLTRKDHIVQPTRPTAATVNPPTLRGLIEVEVGCILEDRIRARVSGDDGEERDVDPVDETG